jgi:hypothetical protein
MRRTLIKRQIARCNPHQRQIATCLHWSTILRGLREKIMGQKEALEGKPGIK